MCDIILNQSCHFNEIGLVPEPISFINSRKDVNPFGIDGKLPVFVAPMTCLFKHEEIYRKYSEVGFIPIYPVTSDNYDKEVIPYEDKWISLTLNQFKSMFVDCKAEHQPYKVLIDCANGHMKTIFDYVRTAKENYPDITVMAGNIANPDTYLEYCKAKIDFVRVGIGGGFGCTTSVKTGFHVSLPYLLNRINILKERVKFDREYEGFRTRVVADGGISDTSMTNKALALGADYVMIGSMVANCYGVNPASSPTIDEKTPNLYYGQSSEMGQIDRFGFLKSVPEGIERYIMPSKSIEDLSDEIEAALRCGMSYANAPYLKDFIGKVEFLLQTPEEYHKYFKEDAKSLV